MHIEKWFLIPRWFIWGNNGREKDLKQKILTIGIVPVLKLFLIRAPELAQWIHACSWDKGDDDQKAARKKKSSAQKFFPRWLRYIPFFLLTIKALLIMLAEVRGLVELGIR